MPSFRVSVGLEALNPGVSPAAVLPALGDAARELVVVESVDIRMNAGLPRIVVRFIAADVPEAHGVAVAVLAEAAALGEVTANGLTVRDGARWFPIGA